MSMPGFTAAMSLFSAGSQYHKSASNAPGEGGVRPADLTFHPTRPIWCIQTIWVPLDWPRSDRTWPFNIVGIFNSVTGRCEF
jgi:hypothetical protein